MAEESKFPIPSDTCCFVLPPKVGLQIISVFTILGAIAQVGTGLQLLQWANQFWGLIALAVGVLFCYSGFLCYKWLR